MCDGGLIAGSHQAYVNNVNSRPSAGCPTCPIEKIHNTMATAVACLEYAAVQRPSAPVILYDTYTSDCVVFNTYPTSNFVSTSFRGQYYITCLVKESLPPPDSPSPPTPPKPPPSPPPLTAQSECVNGAILVGSHSSYVNNVNSQPDGVIIEIVANAYTMLTCLGIARSARPEAPVILHDSFTNKCVVFNTYPTSNFVSTGWRAESYTTCIVQS